MQSLTQNRLVTYSPAYTLVPTYECFNRCTYCNFRVDPGRDEWMSIALAEEILRSLQAETVVEILILSGEVHPQSSRRSQWLHRIYDLGQLALDLGFLPHTNAGPLTFEEMAQLQQVNLSMGLMLEQTTPALMNTVHRRAPSKDPHYRIQQLEWAGELQIPFTTGLLLGIGESNSDRIETLETIAKIHTKYQHIQEVILQPHRPGTSQIWQGQSFCGGELVELVAIARQILPADVAIQIPPNLITSPQHLLDCLAAGATDLGGISPKDEVNPDYPHLHDQTLATFLAQANWYLHPRLPVYPQYESLLSPDLQKKIKNHKIKIGKPTDRAIAT